MGWSAGHPSFSGAVARAQHALGRLPPPGLRAVKVQLRDGVVGVLARGEDHLKPQLFVLRHGAKWWTLRDARIGCEKHWPFRARLSQPTPTAAHPLRTPRQWTGQTPDRFPCGQRQRGPPWTLRRHCCAARFAPLQRDLPSALGRPNHPRAQTPGPCRTQSRSGVAPKSRAARRGPPLGATGGCSGRRAARALWAHPTLLLRSALHRPQALPPSESRTTRKLWMQAGWRCAPGCRPLLHARRS